MAGARALGIALGSAVGASPYKAAVLFCALALGRSGIVAACYGVGGAGVFHVSGPVMVGRVDVVKKAGT